MADERFSTKILDADANETGLVLKVKDDLTTWLVTPDGKEVPVDLTGGGGGGGTVTSVTAGDGSITVAGTPTDPTVAVATGGIGAAQIATNAVGSDELADNAVDTNAIAAGAVTAAKVAADVATQAELDAVAAAAVAKALYDANTILKADSNDTPAALTMAASTILARLASGSIVAATVAEILTLLGTPTNAQAVLQALADAKGDLIAATAADTFARVAVGANGTALIANSAATPGLNWALPPAYLYDRTTYTTNLTSTATTEAGATTVMTSGAITPGAGVAIRIVVRASAMRTTAALGSSLFINLWRAIDGGAAVDLGRVAQMNNLVADVIIPLHQDYVDTPGAGSIVYTVRLSSTAAGTATLFCTSTYMPAALAIYKL